MAHSGRCRAQMGLLAARSIEIRKRLSCRRHIECKIGACMKSEIWEQARAGDLRGAADAAHKALSESSRALTSAQRGELHLVCAFCAMRQGHHAEALRELDIAKMAAGTPGCDEGLALRIATWRAELAYFQGRY